MPSERLSRRSPEVVHPDRRGPWVWPGNHLAWQRRGRWAAATAAAQSTGPSQEGGAAPVSAPGPDLKEAPGGLSRGGWAVPGGSRFSVVMGPVCRAHWIFKLGALAFRVDVEGFTLRAAASPSRKAQLCPLAPSRQLQEGAARDPLNVSRRLGLVCTRRGPAGGREGFSGNALAPVPGWFCGFLAPGPGPCRGFEENGSAAGHRPGHHTRCVL